KEKKQSGEKRYIVTYADPKTDAETASQILNVSSNSVANGVALLETDAEIGGSDILHFDGVGSTLITCSEQRAEELKQDNRILAVEEDAEVFALGTMEDFEQEVETHNEHQDPYFQLAQEYYKQGYEQGKSESQKGLMEQLQHFLSGQTGGNGNSNGNGNGNGHSRLATARTAFQPPADYPFQTSSFNPFQQLVSPPPSILVQPTPWNINMVKAPAAWARGLRGNGIKVAVIDTGIAAHADLGVSGGACFVPGIASFNDDNGHGTHCAGIVAARNNFIGVIGVAPAASLYAVKVLKHDPLTGGASGSTSWVIAGMVWAMQRGIKVVSMSLGSKTPPLLAYKNAITQLTNAGVSVVCAAGNSFGSAFPWVNAPANSHSTAIAVGAVNINKIIAPFSSRGTNGIGWNPVTLVAPGVSVNSTYPFPASSYKIFSGTSMACPHVAGAVALIRQKFPMFTPAQIKFKLITSSSDLGVPGNDPTFGAGLLNCDKATL
ncbi:MAG TPA: S8 family peptidase, partial [Niastella sp.]